MKAIFVTGGAGFLGRHLCRELLRGGYRVIVYDNFSNSSESNFTNEFGGKAGLSYIKGDITDPAALAQTLVRTNEESPVTAVVHLAAIVSVQESVKNPALVFRVNTGGSENVVSAMFEANIQKLVFTSSAAVYGDMIPPLAEEMVKPGQIQPGSMKLSPYGESKLQAEKIILNSGINATIFRIFNVYGKDQNQEGAYPAVIPAFINGLKKLQKIIIYGDGLQSRDFVSVNDVVAVIKKTVETPHINGVFNLAAGREVTLLDLVSILEDIYSHKIEIEFQPRRTGDIKRSFANIDKIRNVFGFSPETGLREGLQDLLST